MNERVRMKVVNEKVGDEGGEGEEGKEVGDVPYVCIEDNVKKK